MSSLSMEFLNMVVDATRRLFLVQATVAATNGHGKIRRKYFTIFVRQHSVTRQEDDF